MIKNTITLAFLTLSVVLNAQETYYNNVNLNLTGVALKEALAVKVTETHTNFLSYTPGVWEASKATDINPENSNEVLLIYGYSENDFTTNRTRGMNQNGGSQSDWNREHVFARSLGDPNLGETGPGADAHHLRPADPSTNSTRSNLPFAAGSGLASGKVTDGWFPGDEWKGDVARMMMYMYLRYGDRCIPTNVGIGNDTATPDAMIDLFLIWNTEDPVSNFERQRNTFHENTNNTYAQGNRNPFIDNPRLATRIWGGPEAEDTWGIYSNSDTEAPTAPTNVSVTNITTFSANISWSASTDNVGVTSYDVYVNGNLAKNTTNTSTSISTFNSNTNYSIFIIAKDLVNNNSAPSVTINFDTLVDIEAPTIPVNIVISNESGNSFIASWDAASDNTAVTGYEVFINGNFVANTAETTYTASGLTVSTTYALQVLAKDAVNNKSALSTAVNARTTDGSTTTANELFFSEYVEGSSFNKALEIANITDRPIDLSAYSIKRQSSGGKDGEDWANELALSGSIQPGDVYVLINSSTVAPKLIEESDFTQPVKDETNFGAPINFNGDDNVGLFKNDILIDAVGVYNSGGGNFAKDVTLRRKPGVIQPNTAFDLATEWDKYPIDTFDNIGQHTASLNVAQNTVADFTLFPNPIKGNILYFNSSSSFDIELYNILGKKVLQKKRVAAKRELDISSLPKGVYLIKIYTNKKVATKKLIRN